MINMIGKADTIIFNETKGDGCAPSPFCLCSGGCGFQRLHGGQGRDGVLVDHLLLAIGHQYHLKAVEARDEPPELETVH